MNRPTKSTLIGIAGVLALWITLARAGFDTGNTLLATCSKQDDFSDALCIGLISGYFEGVAATGTCKRISSEITRKQLRDLVVADLTRFPESRDRAAFELARKSFGRAFACH